MTELLIVAAVMMIVGAMAAPSIANTISAYKLRSRAMDVEGLVQRARMRAVRDNAFYFVRTQQVVINGQTITQVYIDLNNNNVAENGERLIQLPASMSMPNAGTPVLSAATLKFTPEPAATPVAFNARGLPCVVIGTQCTNWDAGNNNQVGFVWFLRDTRRNGNGWAAVSISPAGRVKVWSWNGTAWNY